MVSNGGHPQLKEMRKIRAIRDNYPRAKGRYSSIQKFRRGASRSERLKTVVSLQDVVPRATWRRSKANLTPKSAQNVVPRPPNQSAIWSPEMPFQGHHNGSNGQSSVPSTVQHEFPCCIEIFLHRFSMTYREPIQ